MKIMLSCLLLCLCTSLFSQKIQWYNKEERQKQLYEAEKEDPVIDYLYIPVEDMTLLDQYSRRMQKSGRQVSAAGTFMVISLAAGAVNILDPGNLQLLVGSGIVGFGCIAGTVISLINAGSNLTEAGRLYKDHHLQLQLEATQNGIGMVMRF